MPAVLDRLSTQLNAAQDRYRAIEEIIATEDRDPNESERAEMTSLGEQMRALQPRIEEAVGLERSLSAGTSALGSLPMTQPTSGRRAQRQPSPAERFRSWGEYSHALAVGGVEPAVMEAIDTAQIDYMMRRRNDRYRTIVDVTTPDVPGLVPPIWVTTIVDLIGSARPFVEAFSQLPLPNTGMVVNYPHITQKPLVGKQTTEKTDVASRKTTVSSQNTNVLTYGGGEDVSIQVIQRTDPAYLGLMNELYAEEMALIMDGDAITAAVASITATAVTLSAAAPAAWNNLLAQGVATMYQASRKLPNVFVAGTSLWGAFAGAADSTGRPLFPNVSPFNPVGSMTFTTTDGEVRGMTFVVDPNMAPATGVIGNQDAFTTFLGPVQTMSVDNPTKLGRDYAVFQFAAFAQRRPDAAIKVVLGA
jgi:HK97 family phage major capsid protein